MRPIYAVWELTLKCNLACVHCGSRAGDAREQEAVPTPIASESAYAAITNVVEMDNLIDYMLLHIVAEVEDWPRHNWYAAHRRATNGVAGTKFVFAVWDQELSLDRLVRRNRIDAGNNGGGVGEQYSPARLYFQCRNWPEFRLRFADRVHKHLFNNGALTPAANAAPKNRIPRSGNKASNDLSLQTARGILRRLCFLESRSGIVWPPVFTIRSTKKPP